MYSICNGWEVWYGKQGLFYYKTIQDCRSFDLQNLGSLKIHKFSLELEQSKTPPPALCWNVSTNMWRCYSLLSPALYLRLCQSPMISMSLQSQLTNCITVTVFFVHCRKYVFLLGREWVRTRTRGALQHNLNFDLFTLFATQILRWNRLFGIDFSF